MSNQGGTGVDDEDAGLSPEAYQEWKSRRSEAAHEKTEKIIDIDHEGGTWDINVYLPGDISLRMWILIIVLVLAILALAFRSLIIGLI